MKRHGLLLLLLLGLLFAHYPARSGAAAPALQGSNILNNPGLERPYSGGVAQGWTRWTKPSTQRADDCLNGYHYEPGGWGDATDFVHSGSVSQFIGNNWDTWAGGIMQTVSVTPGVTYRFTFYGRGRAANEGTGPSDFGVNLNMRAGIDPNGSANWADSDVVWGGLGSPHDQWQAFSVQATATGDKVTVFTHADLGVPGVNQCRKFLSTYYDSTELVALGPPPTNTPPPPPPRTNTPVPPTATATPEFTPTPEATATATPTATPEPPTGGAVCVNAFDDRNANGRHDDDEGYMAGVTFTVAGDDTLVGQAVSPGSENAFCFEDVPPGTYQVTQILPGRLEMTTAGLASITVEEGQTVGLEFGSRLRPVEIATTGSASPDTVASGDVLPTSAAVTPAPAATGGTGAAAYIGLAILAVAVLLLGVLLFFLLRRQTG